MNRSVLAALAIVLLAAGCGPRAESNPTAEKAGVDAATAWLALMDEGKYEECWNQGSEYLRASIPRNLWLENITSPRRLMGKLVSRTVGKTQYKTTLPGAPDGEYVLIQCQTVFEKKKAGVESIAVSHGADGAWRVMQYYVQ